MEEMLGGARITYLGHSTFRFVTPGDEQIIIDPFLTENPQTPDDMKQVGELDTILITHGHFDHFSTSSPSPAQTGATTVSNFEIFSYLQRQGIENAMPIQKGGTVEVGGIKVTATNAFHSSSIQLDDGSYDLRRRADGLRHRVRERLQALPRGGHGRLRRHAPDRGALQPRPRPAAHRQPGRRWARSRPPTPPGFSASSTSSRCTTRTFPFVTGTPEEFQEPPAEIAPDVKST